MTAWHLEGFDKATNELVEEHVLTGRSDRAWGDVFNRPEGDDLLGEWEVTEVEAQVLQAVLGKTLDLRTRQYFVGRHQVE